MSLQQGRKAFDTFLPASGVVFALGKPRREGSGGGEVSNLPGHTVAQAPRISGLPGSPTSLWPPGRCTSQYSTSAGPKTSFLVAGGSTAFPTRGPELTVSAGRGGPCRPALLGPRVAIGTLAGLGTPERALRTIEAGGCGRRLHRSRPRTPDAGSAPQERAGEPA